MDDPFSKWRARRKTLEARARRILGVKEGASLGELKKAWRQMARAAHPDINQGSPYSHQRFINVKSAYLVLAKGLDEPLEDIEGAADPLETLNQEEYMNWWIKKWG